MRSTVIPIDPSTYDQQLSDKLAHINTLFAGFSLPNIDIHCSEPINFRMRAEFRIWHEGDTCFYAMHVPGTNRPFAIDEFPIGSTLIGKLMPELLSRINDNELFRKKLYVAEFLTTKSGDALITLIYHKPLDQVWESEARQLSEQIGARIVGRSKKQKLVLDNDFVIEQLTVNNKQYLYQQVETGFTQPNAGVNEQMLSWAVNASADSNGDLLELYCGNGNFTVPLAQNFDRVMATEISKISVNSALFNLNANNVDNVTIVRMSSEDFTDALNGVRPFRRLKEIDLASYNFGTIFVDPPRAGLDDGTVALVKTFDQIIYISCNPDTLKANLEALSDTHSIEKFAIFDQFPYTHHLECGAILQKK
jgi:tRNA (uracil-5-)-methyltransferase